MDTFVKSFIKDKSPSIEKIKVIRMKTLHEVDPARKVLNVFYFIRILPMISISNEKNLTQSWEHPYMIFHTSPPKEHTTNAMKVIKKLVQPIQSTNGIISNHHK